MSEPATSVGRPPGIRTDGPWSARDRALTLVAPALLTAVALVQIVRVHTLDQSSWSGGGFGMFATYECESTRWVRPYLLGEGAPEPVSLPEGLERLELKARVVPTEQHLEDLGVALLEALAERRPPPRGARVELWGVSFEREGLRVEAVPMAAAEVDR